MRGGTRREAAFALNAPLLVMLAQLQPEGKPQQVAQERVASRCVADKRVNCGEASGNKGPANLEIAAVDSKSSTFQGPRWQTGLCGHPKTTKGESLSFPWESDKGPLPTATSNSTSWAF